MKQYMENKSKIIEELQGVRGLAVIFVLLYHFFPEYFPGGFFGVDVFFVLSGFLVTLSFYKSSNVTNFDFGVIEQFYVKRIARILPMAFLVSFLSLFFELLFEEADKLRPAVNRFSAAVLGLTNIRLYSSRENYFAKNSDFSFFTHTWSLGVEEQFYALYSLVLLIAVIFAAKRRERFWKIHKTLIFALLVVSLLLSLYLFMIDPSYGDAFSFYMLPVRIFEIASGVLFYFYLTGSKVKDKRSNNFILGIVFLTWIFFLFLPYQEGFFPFPLGLLIVASTLYICGVVPLPQEQLGNRTFLIVWGARILKSPLIVDIGCFSYSLYLIHWPVVVLIKHTTGLNELTGVLGFLGSCIVSKVAFLYVEQPSNKFFRKKKSRAYFLLFFVIASLVFLRIIIRTNDFEANKLSLYNLVKVDMHSWDADLRCHGKENLKSFADPIQSCLTRGANGKPTMFVNGDSHAMQLVFGLERATDGWGDLRYVNSESEDDSYGFTRTKNKKISREPEVFRFLKSETRGGDIVVLTFSTLRIVGMEKKLLEVGLTYWEPFFDFLEDKGVNVVLFLDTPVFENAPISKCVTFYTLFSNASHCSIARDLAQRKRVLQEEAFYEIQKRHSNVLVYDLFPHFCNEQMCSMLKDGQVVFNDYHHISKEMSLEMGKDFKKFFEKNELF